MQKDDVFAIWSSPPDDVTLQSHQVDVWRVSLDLPVDSVKLLASSLSVDESQRAARFHFAGDKNRYIVAHGALRGILARYLCCEPHQLSFSRGKYGKPALISGEGMEFNLSHSGDYALIAVARGGRVGIDIERMRENTEWERMAHRYFSECEVSELMSLPPEHRIVAFFNCWTRKEAYIKAHGLGLSLPLDSFDVSLTPNEPAVLRSTYPNPHEAARWTLHALDASDGYAGALAIEGHELEYRHWDWSIR